MDKIIILLLVIFIVISFLKPKRKAKAKNYEEKEIPSHDEYDYSNSYKSKWLFTYNEKNAYGKLKEITDKLDLILLAKVRLFDLIEPKKDCAKFKGAMWKVQAKHVDFVICNQKLIAKWIIELDDSSHEASARKVRDNFVDEALTKCGYKVLHTNNINIDEIEKFINTENAPA